MKDKRIFVDVRENCTQAVLIDGDPCDYFALRKNCPVGNIYVGKVANKRGNQCFVTYDEERSNGILTDNGNLKVGDYVKCTVVRDEVGDKGALLDSELTLSGVTLVVSNKIKKKYYSGKLTVEEKARLGTYNVGCCIFRTEAALFSREETEREYAELSELLTGIVTARENSVRLLYADTEENKAIKELRCHGATVVSNGESGRINSILNPIYDATAFIDERTHSFVESIFSRKVEYKGVELVFDETEAMTVVDVNAKGNFGGNNLFINKTAAELLARQISLRNYGGVILVDFIGMSESELSELEDYLAVLLRFDREKCKISTIKELSLIAINRKKRYNKFDDLFAVECEACLGRTICLFDAYDALCRLYAVTPFKAVSVRINPSQSNNFRRRYLAVKGTFDRAKVYLCEDAEVRAFSFDVTSSEGELL